ncbi:MAG TPA: BBE domain-containing protein [Acidobacteriaceae bacterium]|nr:BBE domain-containing protein [Acidobacteriaceae bacterium]
MAIVVSRQDPRYETLKGGHNLRWPAEGDEAGQIVLCENASDAAEALQRIVNAGMRPTIRSGAHCYEDFVANNPGGAILDLSLMAGAGKAASEAAFRIAPGTQLWDGYCELYKRYGVTIPGGTCGTVGAGGHISGGGYGLLSRLHGLTCDWLTAIDILTIDTKGKVVARTVDAGHDPDLFRACRGAGGGNFGIIASYIFDKLPAAPVEVMQAHIQYKWSDLTEERFVRLLKTFGQYWETRGQDPDTWGMFSVMSLSHRSTPGFGMSVQFCNPDGTCKDLTVLNQYLDRFVECGGTTTLSKPTTLHGASTQHIAPDAASQECLGTHTIRRRPWLAATADNAGGPGGSRGKYKSAYFKRGFTDAEARCMYKHMSREIAGVELRGSIIEIDSYGGAINRKGLAEVTAVAQRSSIIKMQPMVFWSKPEEDAVRNQWITEMYSELFSGPDSDPHHAGTPYPGSHYEGCYINYPDKDMLQYPYWPDLYFGVDGLYPFLQQVKRKYDPNNIFHHAMSVRT